MHCASLTVAAFMLIPLGAASAQAVQPRNRDRIRITTAENALDHRIAHVLSISSDSLLLLVAPAETLAVARAGVTQLEVNTGQRSNAGRGARLGALIGVASGALLGFVEGDDPPGWFSFSAEFKALVYGVGLGGTGLVIGAVIGALKVSDRWTSVPLGVAKATPGLRVGRGGTRLSLAISFQP